MDGRRGLGKAADLGDGIASADVSGDGLPEYFLTSMADNKLQVLKDVGDGVPVYSEIAGKRG